MVAPMAPTADLAQPPTEMDFQPDYLQRSQQPQVSVAVLVVVEAKISPYMMKSSCILHQRRPLPLLQQPSVLPSLRSPAFFLLHNW